MPHSKPTVVIATDFAPSSRAAFDLGVSLAKELGGRVLLVHAVRSLGAPGLELTRPDTTKEENETAEPTPTVGLAGTEWVDLARAQGVEADVIVRPGLPTTVIIEEADRVDAHTIVLGSHGKDGLSKAFLGSVADAVRKATDRPVIVVPGEGVAPSESRPDRPSRGRREAHGREAVEDLGPIDESA
ncbi:MAG: universal stress protein [Candidatus Thermoplasmatota archaeon]